MTVMSAPFGLFQQHISLMHGWVPTTVQALAAAALLVALTGRRRRWLPLAALLGVVAVAAAHWAIASNGLASEPAPRQLWLWVAASGVAVGVVGLGWRTARWWRRGVSLLAVPLCLLSAALVVNAWVGYFPTVQNAWGQLTSGPLPDQTSRAAVTAQAAQVQAHHVLPARGSVVPVTISATASGFKHRGELVYLPPAWFATSPPPKLPTVLMLGGEFNTPADWLRAGSAVNTVDAFAAAHHGNAPVLVFADSGGAFNNDTECVNGPRGNVADHLTKDVRPFMTAEFGVSANPANWGIAGWSMGGTCAVDLTTMHPDLFSAFVDIAGDSAPNSGTKSQTINRLFGGDPTAYAAWDPVNVITKHGAYQGISAWFAINANTGNAAPQPRNIPTANGTTPIGYHAGTGRPSDQTTAANTLCALGAAHGIQCAVVAQPGKHDWPFAARVFATALPWLAGALHTPGVPAPTLPAAARSAANVPVTGMTHGAETSTEAAGR